jgi:type II secretory pathway component PulK
MWVLTVASSMTIAFALIGRVAVSAASNRVNLERARWKALGCARRAQAAIDSALAVAPTNDDAAQVWRSLFTAIDASRLLAPCDIALEAAGSRLDINSASGESMNRLSSALGMSEQADEMADAFVDWRDSDDVAGPSGAEGDWYAAHGRRLPTNGSFNDARELALVRGFESFAPFDSLVTTEPGRVSLATAPATVLLAIPGISRELADRIVELRKTTTVGDLADLMPLVSEQSADELQARYPDASRLTTPDPEAWILTASASVGFVPVTSQLRWRLVRAGRQVRVLRVRSVI